MAYSDRWFSFEIKPGRKSQHRFKVVVFRYCDELVDFRSAMSRVVKGKSNNRRNLYAFTTNHWNIRPEKRMCQIGTIGFCMEKPCWVGVGIVAHEMTHAALHTIRSDKRYRNTLKSLKIGDEREEHFVRVVDDMVCQFWNKWYGKRIQKTLKKWGYGGVLKKDFS